MDRPSRRVTGMAWALIGLLLLRPSPTFGQAETGTIQGTVLDPDSKPIPGAAVVVRNDATGDLRTAVTDSTGRFSVVAPQVGIYRVDVSIAGLETVSRTGLAVAAGRVVDASVQLKVDTVQEVVIGAVALPDAAAAAPSQSSLTARSAQWLISNEYIRHYTPPISDYTRCCSWHPERSASVATAPRSAIPRPFSVGSRTATTA